MPLQATSGAASYDAFGGGVAAVPTYIEDIFSTTLYTGNGSTQTINNGIDLAGKGGLTWIKNRTNDVLHQWWTTALGDTSYLRSNGTEALFNSGSAAITYNSDGFSLNTSSSTHNASGSNYVSWTFREQPKFFDVVTGTGPGTFSHSLGAVPGCIVFKATNVTDSWYVAHRGLSGGINGGQMVLLNSTAAASSIGDFGATSTTINTAQVVGSSTTWVAYLFAHNAGGFGLSGTDNVITCGLCTAGTFENLGYEPQWVMLKNPNSSGSGWFMFDNMRAGGLANYVNQNSLQANSSGAESENGSISFSATGFRFESSCIYIAIRRGPMRTPTSGTSVFTPLAVTVPPYAVTAGFPVDLAIFGKRTGSSSNRWLTLDRLRGGQPALITSSLAAENTSFTSSFASNTQFTDGWSSSGDVNVYECFRRAPGFFDEVCYTGTGGSSRNISHNLGAVPEMMIVRRRNQAGNFWFVYQSSLAAGNILQLQSTVAAASDTSIFTTTAPTASVFTVGGDSGVNGSGGTFVAYLFASCPGVSKCLAFTGTGALQTINCGFTGGARFVLIKRTDSTGNWFVWDSSRGLSSSNDPYLMLNSTAAEVTSTNWVDTTATGFQVTAASGNDVNINGASYIALAIS